MFGASCGCVFFYFDALCYLVDVLAQRLLYDDSAHCVKESKMLVFVDWIVVRCA